MGGTTPQLNPARQSGPDDPLLELVDHLLGQVGSPVLLTGTRQLGQQQARSHPDLQDSARRALPNAGHRGGAPLAHLGQRDGPPGVGAVPPGEVLAEGRRGRPSGKRVERLPPPVDGVVLGNASRHVLGRYHVPHQARVPTPVLPRDDDGLAHPGLGEQCGLDLRGFDAVTTQLHLLVRASDELQLADGVPPGEVTGPVHPSPGVERVGEEPRRGQPRTVDVSPSDVRARHVQLAHDTGGRPPQVVVQHVHLDPVEGGADRYQAADTAFAVGAAARHHDGRLRRSVQVEQRRVHLLGEPRGQLDGERFSAGDHLSQRGRFPQHRSLLLLPDEPVQRRGCLRQHGHALGDQQVPEPRCRLGHLIRDHDQASPAQQGTPDLEDGEVEGGGVEQGPDVVFEDTVPVPDRAAQRHEIAVLDHHPLRFPRRSRGVDHVHGVAVGETGGTRFGVGPRGQRRRGLRCAEGEHVHREPRGRPVSDDKSGGCAGQDTSDPRGGLGWFEREVGTASLHHGQHRDDQVQRTGEEDGHGLAHTAAALRQQPGEAVGPRVELGVREGAALEGHRTGGRSAAHQRGEHVWHGRSVMSPLPGDPVLVPRRRPETQDRRERVDPRGRRGRQDGQGLGPPLVVLLDLVGAVHVGVPGEHHDRFTAGADLGCLDADLQLPHRPGRQRTPHRGQAREPRCRGGNEVHRHARQRRPTPTQAHFLVQVLQRETPVSCDLLQRGRHPPGEPGERGLR